LSVGPWQASPPGGVLWVPPEEVVPLLPPEDVDDVWPDELGGGGIVEGPELPDDVEPELEVELDVEPELEVELDVEPELDEDDEEDEEELELLPHDAP
jgi:pilus assembly protein FimV